MSAMVETRGRVIALHDGLAEIRVAAASACASCRTRSVCGSGQERSLQIPAPAHAVVGDTVSLQLPQDSFSLGMLIGYLLPALSMLLGAALLSSGGDALAALGAALGLACGLALARLLHRLLLGDRLHMAATLTCSPHPFPGETP